MNYERDINLQDPSIGDTLLVEDEKYVVQEHCPCGVDSGHVRWFLEGGEQIGPVSFSRQATVAKEWDEAGEIWWWFGRRISASDLRIGYERLPQWLKGHGSKPPERLSYVGKRYHLIGTTDPEPAPDETSDPDTVTLTLWEYTDSDDLDHLLVECSDEGAMTVYHGAYYDPSDLRLRTH